MHILSDGLFGIELPVIDLLMKYKPCISKRMIDGSTPILVAVFMQKREIVKIILSHYADCTIGLYDCQVIKDRIKNPKLYIIAGQENIQPAVMILKKKMSIFRF